MPFAQLSSDTILIVAVVAVAGLVALVLLQGLGLRRRVDEMLQEDTAAHATLRTAADRVARMEAETLPDAQDELRMAIVPELRERLSELARRTGVSATGAARAALERGLAELDDEQRPNREPAPSAGIDRETYAERAVTPAAGAPLDHDALDRWDDARNGR